MKISSTTTTTTRTHTIFSKHPTGQTSQLFAKGSDGCLVRTRRRQLGKLPLPSILLANVQSLDNKLAEVRSRTSYQRDIKNCNILCFTESWLNDDMDIRKPLTQRPETLMQGNLNQFYQISIKCANRGKKILDHLYSTHRDAYKSLPRPPFGKSDHNSILQIPA